jgi:hypothetical protein
MPACWLYRELDDTLRLTDMAADTLADARTGKTGRHRFAGLLRQSVFGRLAGYEDVNDMYRLCRDPAMRWIVGDRAISGSAASASQMGRFETKWLSRPGEPRRARGSARPMQQHVETVGGPLSITGRRARRVMV